jgi:acetylornithine deacetylase/succinyl-diaminopimelate desuccinylase-like protein
VVGEDLPVVRALAAAQQEVTGDSPPPIIRRPGADTVHLNAYGVPCISFGPGGRMHPDSRGASMHAFGEHVLIDDCVAAAKIYLAIALDLCSRRAP